MARCSRQLGSRHRSLEARSRLMSLRRLTRLVSLVRIARMMQRSSRISRAVLAMVPWVLRARAVEMRRSEVLRLPPALILPSPRLGIRTTNRPPSMLHRGVVAPRLGSLPPILISRLAEGPRPRPRGWAWRLVARSHSVGPWSRSHKRVIQRLVVGALIQISRLICRPMVNVVNIVVQMVRIGQIRAPGNPSPHIIPSWGSRVDIALGLFEIAIILLNLLQRGQL